MEAAIIGKMKLPKAYEPNQYEADIYNLWEHNEAFLPVKRGGEGYFSIVAPPPNANANAHLGYALTMAIEDAIVRYYRMQGRETLFVPGADHAGFETWVVYEKKLNDEGKSRFDFSREELYKQVWDFVQGNKRNFESQIRALGASVDWSRFTFTLDNKVVAQAYDTFYKMWHDGLIYRSKRIVNFCTFHGTSFSDIEVVHEEEDTNLWHIAFPLTDGSGEAVIATTRPETKLDQSALMVNPKDERYKHLVGKEVNQPLVPGKPIPVIADNYVDMAFGTGIVTVTPGHDPNDFEVAKRHNLPIHELITSEGKMSDQVPKKYQGLTVLEARKVVAEDLQKSGFLRKVDPYRHSVSKCYKCGTLLEPLLREQWFVKMEPLAEQAVKALKDNKIKFYPKSKTTQLIRYLQGLRDWNISRQIAWGIPIPAFQNTKDPDDWIFDTRVDQDTIEIEGKTYRRDPDVFDTWFSSSSWPYVTLNHPDGEDFKKFYPTSLMETGFDILFPWVARMIMMGLYITGEIPFKDVYLHGLVTDEHGQKMSKSKGNVLNPMDIIGEYGSDALRIGLLAGQSAGNNQPFTKNKVIGGRNFANKLWNISRYVEDKVGEKSNLRADPKPETIVDHWILQRANSTSQEVSKAIESYRLSEAWEQVYHFIWHDLADWYIEASKSVPNLSVLGYVLETSLKLAHPFAPFVTEAIWQTLDWEHDTLLVVQSWPELTEVDEAKSSQFQDVLEIITDIRRLSTAVGVNKPKLLFRSSPVIADNANLIKSLGRVGEIVESAAEKQQGMRINKPGYDTWLDIDIGTAKAFIDKLIDQKAERGASVERLEIRLSNPSYADKAPQAVVDETRQQLEQEKGLLLQIESEIDAFSKLVES